MLSINLLVHFLFILSSIAKMPTGQIQFSLSVVYDFATPRTAVYQVSLSITNSQSSLKLLSR